MTARQVYVLGDALPKGSGVQRVIPMRCPRCQTWMPKGCGRLGPYVHAANFQTKSRKKGALDTWQQTIAASLRALKPEFIFRPRAVSVSLGFLLRRPKSVSREHPTVPPDVDKLVRAVLDSLTGTVYEDDAQVTDMHVTKRYCEYTPGVRIGWAALGLQESLPIGDCDDQQDAD